MFMDASAIKGVDLFKIGGRSISGSRAVHALECSPLTLLPPDFAKVVCTSQ